MRAAYYAEQGPAERVFVIGYQPTPQPGPAEVRVKLQTSGVNPSDWKVRKGGFGRALVAPLIIPHSDGAGVIDYGGRGRSPIKKIGERVWIWNGQWRRAFGTAAEYISVPSIQAVHLPDNVGFDVGACLGIPAMTAMHAVRAIDARPGNAVLVAGGAGAVAQSAIQIAKSRGAHVVATVSNEAKASSARAAGADAVINYKTEDFASRIKEASGGEGIGAVIEVDLTTNAQHYPQFLRPNAIVAVWDVGPEAVLPSLWMMQNSIIMRMFLVYMVADAERLDEIKELTTLLEKRALTPVIATLPEQVAMAHDAVESGNQIGNVILNI